MNFSALSIAILGVHDVRLSVRLSVTLLPQDHIGWKSWNLIARTTGQLAQHNTFALRSPKAFHVHGTPRGTWGNFGGE